MVLSLTGEEQPPDSFILRAEMLRTQTDGASTHPDLEIAFDLHRANQKRCESPFSTQLENSHTLSRGPIAYSTLKKRHEPRAMCRAKIPPFPSFLVTKSQPKGPSHKTRTVHCSHRPFGTRCCGRDSLSTCTAHVHLCATYCSLHKTYDTNIAHNFPECIKHVQRP